MADEIEENAGSETPVEPGNLNADQFASLLMSAEEDQTKVKDDTEDETEDANAEQVDETDEDTEDAEESEDEEDPSAINFDQFTPEQLLAASRTPEGKSKLLARVAELTRKNHEVQEQLDKIQQQKPDPLAKEQTVENPRIAAIKTVDDLAKAQEEAEGVEEWAQNILDANGSAGADEVIYSEGETEYTKERLIAIRNGARKAQKRDIPARLKELERADLVKAETERNDANAAAMIPELTDEESPVKATYDSLMEDPVLKKAFEKVPELRVSAGVIMALAARSLNQIHQQQAKAKPKPATATGNLPKPKVPTVPSGAGAASGKPPGKQKDYENRKRQFEVTGSPDDFAAMLDA